MSGIFGRNGVVLLRKVRIGTRKSRLAVIQAEIVAGYIRQSSVGVETELVPMKTAGDRILDRRLDQIGGKGLFVRELELALRDGRCDIAVHSLKDLPMEETEDLPVLGVSAREDARDVLVLPRGIAGLDPRLPLGTSSPRRMVQLRRLLPGMGIESIRGNVLTRLTKLDRGEYGGLVLAAAGLKRLGQADRISRYFTVEELLPAAGQGILAVQGRQEEDYGYLKGFFDRDAGFCALAERSFVRALGGGCSLPVAAYAKIDSDGTLCLTGMYAQEGSPECRIYRTAGKKEDAEKIGLALAGKAASFG